MENKLKLLIVDDSTVVGDRMRNLLESTPGIHLLGQAFSGWEAMETVIRHRPEILLLDIHMPGENGIAVLKKIKSFDPSITVIMFSNFSDPFYRSIAIEYGAEYFFDKSTEFEKVSELLSTLGSERVGVI